MGLVGDRISYASLPNTYEPMHTEIHESDNDRERSSMIS